MKSEFHSTIPPECAQLRSWVQLGAVGCNWVQLGAAWVQSGCSLGAANLHGTTSTEEYFSCLNPFRIAMVLSWLANFGRVFGIKEREWTTASNKFYKLWHSIPSFGMKHTQSLSSTSRDALSWEKSHNGPITTLQENFLTVIRPNLCAKDTGGFPQLLSQERASGEHQLQTGFILHHKNDLKALQLDASHNFHFFQVSKGAYVSKFWTPKFPPWSWWRV